MRDRLTRHYFDIGLDILWQTVTVDLPELLKARPDVEDDESDGTSGTR